MASTVGGGISGVPRSPTGPIAVLSSHFGFFEYFSLVMMAWF